MAYVRPEIFELSMVMSTHTAHGKDTASGCSGSCCYAEGQSW